MATIGSIGTAALGVGEMDVASILQSHSLRQMIEARRATAGTVCGSGHGVPESGG
jgi:hypothetical protein